MTVRRESLKHIDQALRAELRAQRKALAAYVEQLKANRKAALVKAAHVCSTSKTRAKARAANIRATAREEAAAVVQAAKDSCARGRARARKAGAREQLEATAKRRQAMADERNVLRSKKRKPEPVKRRREQLDEVRADIPANLRPVFEAVKGTLTAKPRQSLTETFIQWAEENPDEVFALQADLAASSDELVQQAIAEQRTAERALRSRKQLRADDWRAIGTTPAELEAVGLNPADPDDVIAFIAGYTQHLKDRTRAAVPF